MMEHHQQDGYSLNTQRATSRYRWINIFHDSVDFVVEEYAAAVVNHARMHEPCLQHSQNCMLEGSWEDPWLRGLA